jgi:hypothetical protein
MAITVGPGMAQQMANNGDHPLYGHESGTIGNQDGTEYSYEKCWGTKGLYVSSNANGQWENVGPFEGGG